MISLRSVNSSISALIHYVKQRTPLSHLSNGAHGREANNGVQLNTPLKGD
jgi:hypothetical protein